MTFLLLGSKNFHKEFAIAIIYINIQNLKNFEHKAQKKIHKMMAKTQQLIFFNSYHNMPCIYIFTLVNNFLPFEKRINKFYMKLPSIF